MLARSIFLCLLSFCTLANAATKKQMARVERIGDAPSRTIVFDTRLVASDTCYARSDAGEYWAINGWVYGAELYKKYLDPLATCDGPYPFQVTEINMMMVFDLPVTFDASVDVELVDLTDPDCPSPGELLDISSTYSVPVPSAGLYNIWIPLDSPVTVTGPFFAGFYIADLIDPNVGAAVVTDTIPVTCQAWNIWDTAVGFVSLDTSWGFPGGLVLYAAGIPGGGGGPAQPDPIVRFCMPSTSDTLYGSGRLWAEESSGSKIIEYVSFSYWDGAGYTEIGRDYSGGKPLRDGVNIAAVGDGWSIDWNFESLSEGTHKIKVMAVDTLDRISEDSVTIFLEPTPPVPTITVPYSGAVVCSPVNFAFSVPDENLQRIDMFSKMVATNYVIPIVGLSQFAVGDDNGNPNDNNLASNGEFGDYYCAPVAAAMALKLWNDRGYTSLMNYSGSPLDNKQLAEALASRFMTRTYKGSYDENVILGIRDYLDSAGVPMNIRYQFKPNYSALRIALEEQEQTVMLAIGGTKGAWVTVAGFTGWENSQTLSTLKIADPATGMISDMQMRIFPPGPMLFYGGGYKPIDAMITLSPKDWNPTRTSLGSDNNGSNGWLYSWDASATANSTRLYLRAEGTDASTQKGSSTVVVQYDCSQAWGAGDYDGNGNSNIADLSYLMSFVNGVGPAPLGGAARGDANCDGRVNIADVIYYMNYLFGNVGAPCR